MRPSFSLRKWSESEVGQWRVTCFMVNVMATRTRHADKASEYRSALLAELASFGGLNQGNLETLVLPGGTAVEDQAPLMHEQYLALRRHGMDQSKLKLIDAALERLDRGEFGICAECEEPIPAKRLKIVPWAAYCVACQERIDSRGDTERQSVLKMIA